ncbi:hypothetical protein [Hyalangium versicolor]|uniref:hypothetical protein n=1 Tax=Hyalangium versicolor TaxID=2861190 RepID=UPI001CCB9862|nr:hypothetical protein [Hyalangium versicolor]
MPLEVHFAVDGGAPLWTRPYSREPLPDAGAVVQVVGAKSYVVLGQEWLYASTGHLAVVVVWLRESPADVRG